MKAKAKHRAPRNVKAKSRREQRHEARRHQELVLQAERDVLRARPDLLGTPQLLAAVHQLVEELAKGATNGGPPTTTDGAAPRRCWCGHLLENHEHDGACIPGGPRCHRRGLR